MRTSTNTLGEMKQKDAEAVSKHIEEDAEIDTCKMLPSVIIRETQTKAATQCYPLTARMAAAKGEQVNVVEGLEKRQPALACFQCECRLERSFWKTMRN